MKINVTRDNVVIEKDSNKPHENEYNITHCYFTFDDFIDSFQVKRVIFTVESTGEMYENDILDYECEIPSEVLEHEYETIRVGVYGYNIGENEELINRFSPSYDTFVVPTGSYKEGALSPEPITPSQYDIYSSKLQEGLDKVDEALEEVSHVDIDAEQLEDGASVTITDRNGEDKTVTIHDGEKGDTGERGPQGVPGYTPKKGIDYFTTNEINDIENTVKEQVKTDLDFDNTIDGIESDIDTINTNLVNYSLITETGSKIALTIDNTTYQMYATLKDKNNNTINTSNIIDLPIEQLVMSVDYDDTTKEIVIELQNGEITRVPVGALISGLVSETQLETILGDYVKNTDYATTNKGGVIKPSNYFQVAGDGTVYCASLAYNVYQLVSNYTFISKGTLENVITGKDLTTKAYVDGLVGDVESLLETLDVGSGV